MELIERIFIARPAESVWAFLEDPENMPLWNPKVKRVSPAAFSDYPRQGYRYSITYQMNDRARASEFQAEYVRFEPRSRLVIELRSTSATHNRAIEEKYELAERVGGTLLTQTIVIGNSGINVFFRLLIRIIQRWGKPTGKRYLETLRDIVEGSATKQS